MTVTKEVSVPSSMLNAAPDGALCHECSHTALTLCPWPVHRPGKQKPGYCDRPTCAEHGHVIADSFGHLWLPGICLEHRNVVLEARAHREEILRGRANQSNGGSDDNTDTL